MGAAPDRRPLLRLTAGRSMRRLYPPFAAAAVVGAAAAVGARADGRRDEPRALPPQPAAHARRARGAEHAREPRGLRRERVRVVAVADVDARRPDDAPAARQVPHFDQSGLAQQPPVAGDRGQVPLLFLGRAPAPGPLEGEPAPRPEHDGPAAATHLRYVIFTSHISQLAALPRLQNSSSRGRLALRSRSMTTSGASPTHDSPFSAARRLPVIGFSNAAS